MRYLVVPAILIAVTSVISAADPPPDYKTKYRVINVHRHCALATEAAIRAENEVCDRVGIATWVCLDGDSPAGSLPAWMEMKRKFPERLVVFWYLNGVNGKKPTFFQDIVLEVEAAAKAGVQGVKVWKDLGMYNRDASGRLLRADDQRFEPFWTKCEELGLPLLWHSADPKEYWSPITFNSYQYGTRMEKDQFDNVPDMPTWDDLIRQRNTVMKRHPKLVVIGAHMGSMTLDLKQLGETFDAYPNFHADTAARLRYLGRLNPVAVRDFFTKYQDRLLFGSDGLVLSKGRAKPMGSANISIYPSEDANWLSRDPEDREDVKRWQDSAVFDFGQTFQYFETSRSDLLDPMHSGRSWLRLAGCELPPAVLEKLYHANAERLIPGLKK